MVFPERKGNEVQRAILVKDVEWLARFEESAEQVAKFSKAGCLDAESIAEMKTRIASHPSTALPVRKKVAEAVPPALPLSPQPLVIMSSILPHHYHQRTMMTEQKVKPTSDIDGTISQNTLRTTGQSLKLGRRDGMSVPLIAK
jgi:hypothetical protein